MTRVGAVQFQARAGDPDYNLAVAGRQLRALADEGTVLAVLPELFGSGYDLAVDQRRLAAATGEKILGWLQRQAAGLQMTLVSAVLATAPDAAVRDEAVIIGPDGSLAAAAKRFLWGDERFHFTAGTTAGALAATRAGLVGVAVCYEAGFPETVRDLAIRGAALIAVPAAFGRPRLHAWELLTRSRALENGCFLVAAGLTGANGSGVEFAGHSRIVGPRGQVLSCLALEEAHLAAGIDLGQVAAARAEVPYLRALAEDSLRTDAARYAR